jgi:hypothetical protein
MLMTLLALTEAAVEERQSRRHQEHERGCEEYECGVSLIHLGGNLSARTQV